MGYPFNFLETLSDLWQSLENLGRFSLCQMFWFEILETANARIIYRCRVKTFNLFLVTNPRIFLLINVKKKFGSKYSNVRRKNCRLPAHFGRATSYSETFMYCARLNDGSHFRF